MLTSTPCITYYSKTTGTCVSRKRIPSLVINSKSSLSTRGHQHCKRLLRHVTRRRAGSLAGAISLLTRRNGGRVTVLNTANGHRSRALNGVDLLVRCLHRKLSIHVCASCNIFVPYHGSISLGAFPNRGISVFSFNARNVHNRNLHCPVQSFDD